MVAAGLLDVNPVDAAGVRGCGMGNGWGVKGGSQSAGTPGGANSREPEGVVAVNRGENNAKHA